MILRDLSCLIDSNRRFLHRCARWSNMAVSVYEPELLATLNESIRILRDQGIITELIQESGLEDFLTSDPPR